MAENPLNFPRKFYIYLKTNTECDGKSINTCSFLILMIIMVLPNLHNKFVNYDDIIRISIFRTKGNDKSSKHRIQECNHLGYLVKDGHNISSTGTVQRYFCKKCMKRFGSETNEWRLYEYQYKIKQILYELFFEGCKQTQMEKR